MMNSENNVPLLGQPIWSKEAVAYAEAEWLWKYQEWMTICNSPVQSSRYGDLPDIFHIHPTPFDDRDTPKED